MSKRFQIP